MAETAVVQSSSQPNPSLPQEDVPTAKAPKYRLVEQPTPCDQGQVGLGVLVEACPVADHLPSFKGVQLLRGSRPAACSPVRVGQCFCVCTVQSLYD